jgi:hypothetical protein
MATQVTVKIPVVVFRRLFDAIFEIVGEQSVDNSKEGTRFVEMEVADQHQAERINQLVYG